MQVVVRLAWGISLLELLFALALLALLACLAAPDFSTSLRAAAVRSATFDLAMGLRQARAEAILQAQVTLLCPVDAAGRCVGAGTAATQWRAFREDGAVRQDLGGRSLPRDVSLRATRSPLRFWPNALSASTSTLTICDARGLASPRALVLSSTGRARIESARPEECLP